MSDRLWAPWRYDYVSAHQNKAKGCVFCSIGDSQPESCGSDEPDYVLHRGEFSYVVLNRFPYINGHLMIVPYRHVPDLSSLSGEELTEIMKTAVTAEKALRDGMHCQGMNGGWNIGSAGGAGIPGHLHLHVLPRWNGDTNFMTTVGEIRVISQSLDKACEILTPYFKECSGC